MPTEISPGSVSGLFSVKTIDQYDTIFQFADSLSIILISSGEGTGQINSSSFEYSGPTAICLNEKDELRLTKSANFEGKILNFSPSAIKPYFDFENTRHFAHGFSTQDIRLVIYLSIFYKRSREYHGNLIVPEETMIKLQTLLKELLKCTPNTISSILIEMLMPLKELQDKNLSVADVIISDTSFEVKDVIMYIHNNCKQKITIPRLSKEFHVNRTTLSDKFYELKCTPNTISSILIEMLMPLKELQDKNLSVADVIISDTSFEVKDVIMYIHNNCKQKITIPRLSKEFHVNRTTLSDKFYEATGETIITYLNKYRINLAAIMLRESPTSISTIAEEVGFNDTAYFAKLFKKYMFHTPSGYRARYMSLCQVNKL